MKTASRLLLILGLAAAGCGNARTGGSGNFFDDGGTGDGYTPPQASCRSAADCPTGDDCCANLCADTMSDPANCGACGQACAKVENGTAACVKGACAIGGCSPGFADCNGKLADGCETKTDSDGNNCGACGKRCPMVANGSGSCVKGACTMTCDPGHLHCSMNPADGCEIDSNTDVANCGSCGNACPMVANGQPACNAGACAIGSCNAGFGDCNMNAKDGCETDLTGDPKNCGGCGKACNTPNATPLCKAGTCALGPCDNGFADCDGLAVTGCETQTNSDPNNCGACGRACFSQNAKAGCMTGQCVLLACNPGFSDCDGNAANGCETSVSSDVNNCGGCGKVCPRVQNGTTVCINGGCAIGSCNFGFADCNQNPSDGCEANLLSPTSCGSCNSVCPVPPNATAGCKAGVCGIGACNMNFGDCDGNAANGCEKNLSADPGNCGACGKVCNLANAQSQCTMGACAILSCNAGYADCDGNPANGCEARVASDPNNCGGCKMACSAPANASATCANSACGFTCNAGFGDCDKVAANGCEKSLLSDASNCGACGNVCGALANATPACKSGVCGIGSCNMDWGNCDGVTANGCETNLVLDASNCGMCGVKCTFANAAGVCNAFVCVLGACNPGYANCDGVSGNGCEVNLKTDANNCGACNAPCPMGQTCNNGVCGNLNTILFDSIPSGATGSSVRGTGGDSCGTNVNVSGPVTIHAIAVSVTLNTNGNIKFMIWNKNTGQLLYISTAKAFNAGSGWKQSDALSYTLQAGNYDIGGISDAAGNWDYDTTPNSQGVFSSTSQNPNWTNYTTPAVSGRGGADCGIRLY